MPAAVAAAQVLVPVDQMQGMWTLSWSGINKLLLTLRFVDDMGLLALVTPWRPLAF